MSPRAPQRGVLTAEINQNFDAPRKWRKKPCETPDFPPSTRRKEMFGGQDQRLRPGFIHLPPQRSGQVFKEDTAPAPARDAKEGLQRRRRAPPQQRRRKRLVGRLPK